MTPLAKLLGKSLFIFALFFTGFFMLFYSARRHQEPVWAKNQVVHKSKPFQKALTSMTESVLFYAREFFVLQKREEIRQLENRAHEYEDQVRNMDEVMAENERLKRLLDYKRGVSQTVTMAQVLYRDPSNWTRTITIDQGGEQGFVKGMAVLAPAGVVGKIIELSPDSSKVMLLTDPACRVSALIKRSRVIGTVTGRGDGMLEMHYLSGEDDIQMGDSVLSAGEGRIFPKGAMIGSVEKVLPRHEGLSLTVVVKPSVEFNKLEEVLIVRKVE